jgi:ABC-type uncharacterized transport system ATPase subunit
MTEPLLAASNLRRTFGGITALDGVSFDVAHGDLRCIIGPNGAGKSTLFNILCGTLRPSLGHVLFEGHDITRLPIHHYARVGIARKFQVPSVFETMTVEDNLAVSSLHATPAEAVTDLARLLHLLSLEPVAGMLAGDLAHGQKQWLEIGMALMSRPRLLLLDEPTAGMSVEETRRTADLLLSLKGSVTIIAIEHDMHFVRALDCRTMVLHQGAVIAEGPFAEIERNETVRDVYFGRH